MNEVFANIKDVYFKYTLDTVEDKNSICISKIVLQIIYIIIILHQIRTTFINKTWKNGIIMLVLLLVWIYINLSYQSKLCSISGNLGSTIRIYELIFILMRWAPYFILLFIIYIVLHWTTSNMSFIKSNLDTSNVPFIQSIINETKNSFKKVLKKK